MSIQILSSISIILISFLGLFLQRITLYSSREIRDIMTKLKPFDISKFYKDSDGKYWFLDISFSTSIISYEDKYKPLKYISIDNLNLTMKEKRFLCKWIDNEAKKFYRYKVTFVNNVGQEMGG